ncbi:MAG: hypothetical protein AAF717_19180 [Bacteroidota bacterium]
MKNWIWQNTPQHLNWQQRFANRRTLFLFTYGVTLEDHSEKKERDGKNTIPVEDYID